MTKTAATDKAKLSIIPATGERFLIVGQTGSGKSIFANWMLRRLPHSPLFIHDAKGEDSFAGLPNSRIVSTMGEALAAADDVGVDYVIVRPPVDMLNDPEALDDMLLFHYNYLQGCPIFVDEAYAYHRNGQALKGLTALLTRGRSKGITCGLGTQRPAWVSRFCFSEAQHFYIFYLQLKDDKKKVASFIPAFEETPDPPKFGFYYYAPGKTPLTKYSGVTLEKPAKPANHDLQPEAEAAAKVNKRVWI